MSSHTQIKKNCIQPCRVKQCSRPAIFAQKFHTNSVKIITLQNNLIEASRDDRITATVFVPLHVGDKPHELS